MFHNNKKNSGNLKGKLEYLIVFETENFCISFCIPLALKHEPIVENSAMMMSSHEKLQFVCPLCIFIGNQIHECQSGYFTPLIKLNKRI